MDSRAGAFTALRSLGWDGHASFRHCICIFFFILARMRRLSTVLYNLFSAGAGKRMHEIPIARAE